MHNKGKAKFFTLKIEKTESKNPTTTLITFKHKLHSKPGQFVMAWVPGVSEKPLSVAFEDAKTFSLLVAQVGEFSKKLCSLKKGDRVWVRGPFGNAFERTGKNLVMVGGGFGVAPLWFFASQNKDAKITFVEGARNKDLLLLKKEIAALGVDLRVCTDDGSEGFKGFTTQMLERVLSEGKVDCVYACGPEKMLYRIMQLCEAKGVECQLSLERYMKCGFGVCGQCDCDGLLVCRDGPIFTGKQLKNNKDFGVLSREPSGLKKKL